MLRTVTTLFGPGEVSKDLVQATGLGARLAARHRRSAGQADVQILSEVAADIREILEDEGLEMRQVEALMAEVRRAIAQVLADDDDDDALLTDD